MKKIKLYDLLGTIGIISAMIYYTLNGSYIYNESIKILLAINVVSGFVIILLRIIKKINIREILIILFTCFLTYKIGDTRFLIALSTIYCMISVNFEKNIKYAFYTKLFCFILVIVTGGYFHINGIALHFGIIMLLCIYIIRNKKNGIIQLLLFGFYLIFSFVTKSGSLIISGFILFFLIFIDNTKLNKLIRNKKIYDYIFLICFILNILGAIFINVNGFEMIKNYTPTIIQEVLEKIFGFVDKISTSRIQLANYSLRTFGVLLIGGNIDYELVKNNSASYFNLDSGYIWLLQGFGVIMTIVFLIYTILMLKRARQEKDYYVIYISIIIAIWALNEDILSSIGFNISLLLFSKYFNIYKDKHKEDKNGNT